MDPNQLFTIWIKIGNLNFCGIRDKILDLYLPNISIVFLFIGKWYSAKKAPIIQ
jgi:hypothetical protein